MSVHGGHGGWDHSFAEEDFDVRSGEIDDHDNPEDQRVACLVQSGKRDVGCAKDGEHREDHVEGPRPTLSMEKADPGRQPDEAEEEKDSAYDDPDGTDQGSNRGKSVEYCSQADDSEAD